MAWETYNGNRYYYLKSRRRGRVVSTYIGPGVVGAEAEAFAKLISQGRRAENAARAARREAAARLDRKAAERYREVTGLVDAALALAGWRRHKRGPWRRKRMSRSKGPTDVRAFWTRRERLSPELLALVKDAEKGKSARDQIAHGLRNDPERFIELGNGDLAEQAADCFIALRFAHDEGEPPNRFQWNAVKLKYHRLQDELAGPDATPVVRLLAERVAACWLQLYELDIVMTSSKSRCEGTAWLDKYRDRAHRRYVGALRAIAQVQALGLDAAHPPATIQVNLAGQQVVNGPPASAAITAD